MPCRLLWSYSWQNHVDDYVDDYTNLQSAYLNGRHCEQRCELQSECPLPFHHNYGLIYDRTMLSSFAGVTFGATHRKTGRIY